MLTKLARGLGFIGGAWGLLATLALFTLPMYQGISVRYANGQRIEERSTQTLLEVNAPLQPITISFFGEMIAGSALALLTALAAKTKHRVYGALMTFASVMLLAGSFLAGFSVGPYYLPGAVMVIIAGILLLI
jgi:hypothetical protein